MKNQLSPQSILNTTSNSSIPNQEIEKLIQKENEIKEINTQLKNYLSEIKQDEEKLNKIKDNKELFVNKIRQLKSKNDILNTINTGNTDCSNSATSPNTDPGKLFYKSILNEMNIDMESLDKRLYEKINQNNSLFKEYSSICIELENKQNENSIIKSDLTRLYQSNHMLMNEKDYLEKVIFDLRHTKNNHKQQLDKILHENDVLSKKCFEQEENLKQLENERGALIEMNHYLNKENKELYMKLKEKEHNLIGICDRINDIDKQRMLDEERFHEVSQKMSQLKLKIDELEKEKSEINEKVQKEKEENQFFINTINDKEYDIKRLEREVELSRVVRDRLYEDNIKIYNLIEELNAKSGKLTDGNETIIKFVDEMKNLNNNMKDHISKRGNYISNLNKSVIDIVKKANINIEDYMNKDRFKL